MLTKQKLTNLCGDLIKNMFPEEIAISFGFSEDESERFWVSQQNQVIRDSVQTMLFFSFKNSPWKSTRGTISGYTNNNKEYIEEMRQLELVIDVYSKISPPGTAYDILRYVSARLNSSFLENWNASQNETFFAFENMDFIDLTALLQTQTWSERQRGIIKLNYRDRILLEELYMTRVPTSISDVPNSVKVSTKLKNPYK